MATRLLGLAAETQPWLPNWKEQQALSSKALLFLIPREKQKSDMGGVAERIQCSPTVSGKRCPAKSTTLANHLQRGATTDQLDGAPWEF